MAFDFGGKPDEWLERELVECRAMIARDEAEGKAGNLYGRAGSQLMADYMQALDAELDSREMAMEGERNA